MDTAGTADFSSNQFKHTLKGTELFRELPDEAVEELSRHVSLRAVEAGKNVFERNSPGDEFYVVKQGEIELIIPTHPSVPADPLRENFNEEYRRSCGSSSPQRRVLW